MRRKKIWFYISLFLVLSTLFLLITGSSMLTIPLDKNNAVPSGTFITWIGIISLPLTIYWGVKELRHPSTLFNKFLALMLVVMIILAVLWVPICYLLSGNISFSFSEKDSFQGGQLAMRWFWRFSYSVALGPILLLIAYWISLLWRKRT